MRIRNFLKNRRQVMSLLLGLLVTAGMISFQNCGKRITGLTRYDMDSMGPVPPRPSEGAPLPSQIPSPTVSVALVPDPSPGFKIGIKTCRAESGFVCAEILGDRQGSREVKLVSNALNYGVIEFGRMGTHLGGIDGMAYVYAGAGYPGQPVLFILDLDNTRLLASTRFADPYTLTNSYFSLIRDPSGKTYPFLAPGARYLSQTHLDYLCLFDPTKLTVNDAKCGMGFKAYTIGFQTNSGTTDITASGFRHNRGWVEDIDGDGWDDIHLPYLKFIHSVSGRTGQSLSLTTFDVAALSEPSQTPFFHSGRFLGTFSALSPVSSQQSSGADRLVAFTGGSPVGSFADVNCGVSRFAGAFRWNGNAGSLVWSKYFSFGPTIFKAPYNNTTNYARLGNDVNQCVHRFGDSVVTTGSRKFLVLNIFQSQANGPVCQEELMAVQGSDYASTEEAIYNTCARSEIGKARGTWDVVVYDAATGAEVSRLNRAYAWGLVGNFRPNEISSLVLEILPASLSSIPFDQASYVPSQFRVAGLTNDGTWLNPMDLNSLAGRPTLLDRSNVFGSQPPSKGSTSGALTELKIRDLDLDGFNDFQMTTGRWVGYSGTQNVISYKGIQP